MLMMVLAILHAPVIGNSLYAQGPNIQSRIPVTVVLAEVMERNGDGIILQDPTTTPSYIIVLPADKANAKTLSTAVLSLLQTQAGIAPLPPNGTTLRFRSKSTEGEAGRPVFPWAGRVIAELQRAPIRTIVGVGNGRAIDIWLPAAHFKSPSEESGQ
jgi:hypothetical protein